jgi:hypothetical protein
MHSIAIAKNNTSTPQRVPITATITVTGSLSVKNKNIVVVKQAWSLTKK